MNLSFLSASDVPIGTAALYAVIGFVIVLGVLALLVGIFLISGLIFRTKALSKDKLFEKKEKPNPEPEFVPSAVPERNNDDEIVAAITAAITVILSEECGESEKPEFVIRKIVRK
ncbi:MAG: OadG family protein [Clostridiales bacterium]|nr:OadG family protein [Clostridiales bacterium]